MAILRRKCKLTNSEFSNVDLRRFEKTTLDTINKTIPGKNPKVYKEYFSTDVPTQSEAVTLGRALAKVDELKVMGKTVTTFRIFDGKVCSAGVKERRSNEITTYKRKYISIMSVVSVTSAVSARM